MPFKQLFAGYEIAIIVSVAGFVSAVKLLTDGYIGEITFLALVALVALAAIAIAALPRLRVLDLKRLTLTLHDTLHEIRDVQAKVEKTKSEIVEMYGGIENLKREPFVLDESKRKALGHKEGIAWGSSSMRYQVGCIKRERERLARIFANQKAPKELAEAILDSSMDELVFKWNGPETALDVPPTPLEQRDAEEAAKAGDDGVEK